MKKHIEKFIEATGVEERRFVDNDKCASDLCYKSACQIFEETSIKPEDIDVLLFVSQTADYKIPGTSIILQDKLGLKKTTIVYDINIVLLWFYTRFINGVFFSSITDD